MGHVKVAAAESAGTTECTDIISTPPVAHTNKARESYGATTDTGHIQTVN